MESRHDGENAEKILYNMSPTSLVSYWNIMDVMDKPLNSHLQK